MSAVCFCEDPVLIRKTEGVVCSKCHCWWDPKFGSLKPGEKRAKQVNLKSAKIPRNDPCPCGSGLKAKRCCHKTKGVKFFEVEAPTTSDSNT